ncbi:hypothetical protein FOMPIDRAFT_1108910, partial [Fomitopsis schrenkii]
PLELFENILDFLRWETRDLYNCALVCSAWHRHSQRLLYSRVVIKSRNAYDAVVQSSSRDGRSREYLTGTNILVVGNLAAGRASLEPREYLLSIPLALGRSMCSLRCLEYYETIQAPYHPSFTHSFLHFSALIHLKLDGFQLHSFNDLCSIICALKTLRELDLRRGR